MEVLADMIDRVWDCLSVPIVKNPLFTQTFPDLETLSDICFDAELSFPDTLLDAVQSDKPPTVDFFKALPTTTFGNWGVYALVLEKAGETTIVYGGSGTSSVRGVAERWTTYDRCNQQRPNVTVSSCPSLVKEALNNGYRISYKGLLVWAPMPSARDVPRIRLLFYALEAMFSYLFWTHRSRTKDYEIRSCCPWSPYAFTYAGGCSHNCLRDNVKGNFDFDPEELEELARQSAASAMDSKQRYKARRKADDPDGVQRESKEYYERKKAEDPVGFKKYFADRYQHNKIEAPEMVKKWYDDRRARVKADPVLHQRERDLEKERYKITRPAKLLTKKFYCALCDRPCAKQSELNKHNESKRHKTLADEAARGYVRKYKCKDCVYSSDEWRMYREHRRIHHGVHEVLGAALAEVSDMDTDST